MLYSILNILDKYKYNQLFTSDRVVKLLDNNIPNFQLYPFDDVRSATFIALGNNQKADKHSILIIFENELSHCMTAITECWFQKQSFIIITLSSDNKTMNLLPATYFNDVTDLIFNITSIENFEQILMQSSQFNSPIILQVNINQQKKLYNTSKKYLDFLTKNENLLDKAFIFDEEFHQKNDKVEYFSDTYGALSKYLGFTEGYRNKSILIIPYFLLKKDLNIFNSRYFNSRFKIIVYNCEFNINGVLEWIKSNGIYCEINDDIDNVDFETFINLEQAATLFIVEGSK